MQIYEINLTTKQKTKKNAFFLYNNKNIINTHTRIKKNALLGVFKDFFKFGFVFFKKIQYGFFVFGISHFIVY